MKAGDSVSRWLISDWNTFDSGAIVWTVASRSDEPPPENSTSLPASYGPATFRSLILPRSVLDISLGSTWHCDFGSCGIARSYAARRFSCFSVASGACWNSFTLWRREAVSPFFLIAFRIRFVRLTSKDVKLVTVLTSSLSHFNGISGVTCALACQILEKPRSLRRGQGERKVSDYFVMITESCSFGFRLLESVKYSNGTD